MNTETLRELEAAITQDVPKFRVAFKDESAGLWLIGLLSFFNPDFMRTVTTTLGYTVWFPTRVAYEADPARSLRILMHEYVHMRDRQDTIWFGLSYAFPQVLAALPVAAFMVLVWPWSWLGLVPFVGYFLAALVGRKTLVGGLVLSGLGIAATAALSIWLTGWWAMLWLAFIACLVPWPAPWRTHWEMRGYIMSVAVAIWMGRPYTNAMRESLLHNFTGPTYFFMSWRKEEVTRQLDEGAVHASTGLLQKPGSPYFAMFAFLANHGLIQERDGHR